MVITNTNYSKSKGPSSDIFVQLVAEPKILLLIGFSLLFLGLVPGLPLLPFFLVGGFLLVLGFVMIWVLPSTNLVKLFEKQGLNTNKNSNSEDSLSWSANKGLGFDEDSLLSNDTSEMPVLVLEIDKNHLEPYLKNNKKKNSEGSLEEVFSSLVSTIYRDRGVNLPRCKFVASSNVGDFSYQVLVRGNNC